MAVSRKTSSDSGTNLFQPLWSVQALDAFMREFETLLNVGQAEHFWDVVKDMVMEDDPLKCPTVEVVPISLSNRQRVYALRDRAGILKKIQLQAFFDIDPHGTPPRISLLGVCDLSHSRKVPFSVSILLELRLEQLHGLLANNKSTGLTSIAVPGSGSRGNRA